MLLTNPPKQDHERRKWLLLTGATAGVAAVATAVPFVSGFSPSEPSAASAWVGAVKTTQPER
jgi:Rieske Fe-S protein